MHTITNKMVRITLQTNTRSKRFHEQELASIWCGTLNGADVISRLSLSLFDWLLRTVAFPEPRIYAMRRVVASDTSEKLRQVGWENAAAEAAQCILYLRRLKLPNNSRNTIPLCCCAAAVDDDVLVYDASGMYSSVYYVIVCDWYSSASEKPIIQHVIAGDLIERITFGASNLTTNIYNTIRDRNCFIIVMAHYRHATTEH